jgi:VanZ family protein
MSGDFPARQRVGRAMYAASAVAFAIFLIYGSIVPLNIRVISLTRALSDFSRILRNPIRFGSDSDSISNLLLGVPLGYLMLAALMTDRPGWVRRAAAGAAVIPCALVISVTAEFLQLFSRGRTSSVSDIAAQGIGAIAGVGVWFLVGDRVTLWLRGSLAEREAPALFNRVLVGYCALFALYQIMPLDLTISLSQLAEKYRHGLILVKPFSYSYASRYDMWWDYGTDVLLNAPVGMAAVLVWTGAGKRRSLSSAIFLGVVGVALLEFAQLFVKSRFADATDLITGGAGVAVGALIVTTILRRDMSVAEQPRLEPSIRLARIGTIVWIGILASYHWNPFDFTTARAQVIAGMHSFFAAPFSSYYEGSEFHALTEAVRKALLALPLGALLRLSLGISASDRRGRLKAFAAGASGFCVLVAIEFGQVFLPTRVADITDAMFGELGLLVGLWLATRLTLLSVAQRFGGDLAHQRRP